MTDEILLEHGDRLDQIGFSEGAKQGLKPLLNGLWGWMTQPDEDDARPVGREGREQMGKVQIHRQDDPPLLHSPLQDFRIAGPGKAEISGMHGIVPRTPKPHGCLL